MPSLGDRQILSGISGQTVDFTCSDRVDRSWTDRPPTTYQTLAHRIASIIARALLQKGFLMMVFSYRKSVFVAFCVVGGFCRADSIDPSVVSDLWRRGDSFLECLVHENATLRGRCEDMARGMAANRPVGETSMSAFMERNPMLAAALYHPVCKSFKGLELEQCGIRERLKQHERQSVTSDRAAFILNIVGRGQ